MVPSMPIHVRAATPADLDVLVAFNLAMARESEGRDLPGEVVRRGVEACLLAPGRDARYRVAERDGEVVGQSMVTREWSDWRAGWFWWIQSVYVRPDARRLGVFRALYEAIRGEARGDPSVVGLRLYVEHSNAPARQTYRRLGMVPTGYDLFEVQWRESGG